MITLATLGIIIFTVYVTVAVVLFGIPKSLSDTFYLYGGRPFGHVFTITMWVVSFLILPYWLKITPESIKFMPFLSVAGLTFVGAAPLFKKEDKGWHSAFAIGCAIFAILWAILAKNVDLLAINLFTFVVVSLLTETLKSCKTFWLEMVAFGTIFSSLLKQMVIDIL